MKKLYPVILSAIFFSILCIPFFSQLSLSGKETAAGPAVVASILKYLSDEQINFIYGGGYPVIDNSDQSELSHEKITKDNFDQILKKANLLKLKALGITVITPKFNRLNLSNLKFFSPGIPLPPKSSYLPDDLEFTLKNGNLKVLNNDVGNRLESAGIIITIPGGYAGRISCGFQVKKCGAIRLLNILKLMWNINGYDIVRNDKRLEIIKIDLEQKLVYDATPLTIPFQFKKPDESNSSSTTSLINRSTFPKFVYVKGDFTGKDIGVEELNGVLKPVLYMNLRGQKFPRFLETVTTPVFFEEIDGKQVPFTNMVVGKRKIKVRVTKFIVPPSK